MFARPASVGTPRLNALLLTLTAVMFANTNIHAAVDVPQLSVPETDYGDAAGYGDAGHQQSGLLETVVASGVGDAWQTVSLRTVYDSPVIVCTRELDNAGLTEAGVRVNNRTNNSFDVRLQVPSDQPGSAASDVYCLVAEEGDYDLTAVGGPKFEARTTEATETNGFELFFGWDSADTVNITPALAQTYTSPVVLGQVMSFNDSRYSQFWTHDCTDRANPPTGAAICVGKHVGKNDDLTVRNNETLGYMVFESASGTINERNWVAAVGPAFVEGVDNSPPYTYGLTGNFVSGTVTQTAEIGGQGGFAVLFGGDPLADGELDLAIDEDTTFDDRTHLAERVAYFLMETAEGILLQEPYMGFNPGDREDPQSDANALADDLNDTSVRGVGSDETGVSLALSFTPTLTLTATVRAQNPTAGDVTLCGWMDGPVVNGSFDAGEVAEEGCVAVAPGSSDQTLTWTGLPESGYTTFLRFRISSDLLTAADAVGIATDGEAEDFIVEVIPPPSPERDFGDAPEVDYGDAFHGQAPLLETREVSGSGDNWTTVNLRGDYQDPVVVCTPILSSAGDAERVIRVRNVASESFEVRAQRPGGVFVGNWQASCLVVEAGDSTLPDGRRIVAGTVESDLTSGSTLAAGWLTSQTENVSPAPAFTEPAVFGQVMSFNDTRFSAFWSNNCSARTAPPDSGGICVGKHVGEDTSGRGSETLGYIIVETTGGTIGSVAANGAAYEVFLGTDSIQGVGGTPPPYTYALSSSDYVSGVAIHAAMDGADGGWAVLLPPNAMTDPVSAGEINLAIDEDTIGDGERNHTAEQVAVWVFDRENAFVTTGPHLGVIPPDLESASQYSAGADGDDTNDTSEVSAGNDEDGVTFTYTSPGTIQASVTVNNFADTDATVCAWLDVPNLAGVADGSFDVSDLGTPGCVTVSPNTDVPQAPVLFSWNGLPTSVSYSTYARVRISTDALTAADSTGGASDGEVEDYQIVVDPTAVTLASFGLEAMPIEQFVGSEGAPVQVLLAMLASWDESQAGLLEDSSREDIAAALIDYLDPDGDGQVAQLIWETVEERGTLGYYIERRSNSGHWTRINNRMLPSLPIAPMGAQYQLLDPEADLQQVLHYRLIEQEARGSKRTYGPFVLEVPSR
ncbi:hypothetical protein GCM10007052_32430 [Halioglobus japonicus]|nr:GEVED domain-containing protein [Halioglobus japonicus]GHD21535.1 hypothetical protein GCM10007052_32430 [Halioglobus japonicus]